MFTTGPGEHAAISTADTAPAVHLTAPVPLAATWLWWHFCTSASVLARVFVCDRYGGRLDEPPRAGGPHPAGATSIPKAAARALRAPPTFAADSQPKGWLSTGPASKGSGCDRQSTHRRMRHCRSAGISPAGMVRGHGRRRPGACAVAAPSTGAAWSTAGATRSAATGGVAAWWSAASGGVAAGTGAPSTAVGPAGTATAVGSATTTAAALATRRQRRVGSGSAGVLAVTSGLMLADADAAGSWFGGKPTRTAGAWAPRSGSGAAALSV